MIKVVEQLLGDLASVACIMLNVNDLDISI